MLQMKKNPMEFYRRKSRRYFALDQSSSRDFLEQAIDDYNKIFQTMIHRGHKFQNYKDVSLQMKNMN